MKLGSLFDGIGGFPLAGQQFGIKPVWASEIEPAPISITKRHFPNMKHLGDITKINGADIEPVDIITFGSPCQDLSVAGNRAGLDGNRSGLFMEAIRIIREMRIKTNGICPRVIVWENVPGAFSSSKGEDFRTVLQEITETAEPGITIPRPSGKRGKWDTCGAIMGDGWSLAWRVLDAQYWGVPQRRRRIFAVADFGSDSAGEILFKREGLYGDLTESGTTREGIANDSKKCIRISSADAERVVISSSGGNIVGTLDASYYKGQGVRGGIEREYLLFKPKDHDEAPISDYTTLAIDCRNHKANEISATLQSKLGGGSSLNYINPVAVPFGFKAFGEYAERETGKTLMTCDDVTTVDLIVSQYVVRRLTPMECERLQGFPDGWTEYGHDGKAISDTQRYRALGNSVAIPCTMYVLQGVVEVLSR